MKRQSRSLKRLLRDIVRFLRGERRRMSVRPPREQPPPLLEAGVPARPLRPYSSGGAAVALELPRD